MPVIGRHLSGGVRAQPIKRVRSAALALARMNFGRKEENCKLKIRFHRKYSNQSCYIHPFRPSKQIVLNLERTMRLFHFLHAWN